MFLLTLNSYFSKFILSASIIIQSLFYIMPGAPTGGHPTNRDVPSSAPFTKLREVYRLPTRPHTPSLSRGKGGGRTPRAGGRGFEGRPLPTRPKIPEGQGRPPHEAAPVSCQYPLPNQGSGTARRGTTVADGGVGRGERNMSSARVRPVEPWRAPTLAGCHRRGHVT